MSRSFVEVKGQICIHGIFQCSTWWLIVCQFDLIEKCIFKLFSELTKRDVPGFAIGGLSGGESKDEFWKIVNISTDYLPKEKPRYLMGVG